MRQSDPLLPNLFNCIIEEGFRNINWENKGIKIDGEYLNNLRYAYEAILFANNMEELEGMLIELITKGEKVGLSINFQKMKILGRGEKNKHSLNFKKSISFECS